MYDIMEGMYRDNVEFGLVKQDRRTQVCWKIQEEMTFEGGTGSTMTLNMMIMISVQFVSLFNGSD